jgi:hydroxymethylpyrimidine pyrophosphatase-like HAD family hydrolase
MRPPTIQALPRAADVQLIITDVDGMPPFPLCTRTAADEFIGTLLDSRLGFPHTSPTYSVLRRIRSTHPDVPIVISTGKTIRAAAHLRRDLDLAPFPTCHLNGNLVYASTGEIIHESTLLLPVIEKVYETCRAAALSLCLFDRDRVYHVLPFGTISVEKANRLFRGYGEEIVELQEADDVMRRVRDGAINVISMAVCETSECLRG